MNMPSPKTNPIGRLEREIRSLTGRLSKSSSSTGAEIAEIQAAIAGIESQISEIVPGDPEAITAIQEAITALGAQIQAIDGGSAYLVRLSDAMYETQARDLFPAPTPGNNDYNGVVNILLRNNIASFTMDGIALSLGDKVLFKNIIPRTLRGAYIYDRVEPQTSYYDRHVFVRDPGIYPSASIPSGAVSVLVQEGTRNAGIMFTMTALDPHATTIRTGLDDVVFLWSGESLAEHNPDTFCVKVVDINGVVLDQGIMGGMTSFGNPGMIAINLPAGNMEDGYPKIDGVKILPGDSIFLPISTAHSSGGKVRGIWQYVGTGIGEHGYDHTFLRTTPGWGYGSKVTKGTPIFVTAGTHAGETFAITSASQEIIVGETADITLVPMLRHQAGGNITISNTPPPNPQINDVWLDTSTIGA